MKQWLMRIFGGLFAAGLAAFAFIVVSVVAIAWKWAGAMTYDAIQRETVARLHEHLANPHPTAAKIKARIPQPRVHIT